MSITGDMRDHDCMQNLEEINDPFNPNGYECEICGKGFPTWIFDLDDEAEEWIDEFLGDVF